MPKKRIIYVKQQDAKDCGAACLASIGKYYGTHLPIARIRAWAGTDQLGTNVLGLMEAANRMGFRSRGVKAVSGALRCVPLPAIAHLVLKGSYLNHYVVIYEVDNDYVKFMDPAKGKLVKSLFTDFCKIWSGVLILCEKKRDFKASRPENTVYRRFHKLLRPHWKVLFLAILAALVYTVCGLALSIYIQKITDDILADANLALLQSLSLAMLAVVVLRNLAGSLKSILVLKTGQHIDAQLIMGYYRHLMVLPQRFFDTMKTGEIISRLNDAVKIRAFINNALMECLVNLMIVLFAVGLMFVFYWKLALMVLLIIPLYTALYLIVNHKNKTAERSLLENTAKLESGLVENLSHIRTLKLFGCEGASIRKMEKTTANLLESGYRSAMISIVGNYSGQFLTAVFTVVVLWTGTISVLNGHLTAGELFSFFALLAYFTAPLTSLIGMNTTVQSALVAADRLFEIMDLEQEGHDGRTKLKNNNSGDIYFEQVDFRYGTRVDVFESLSLRIRRKEITAIVGESGSGKSTLFSLLLRLYPLKRGMIRIGSFDLNEIDKKSLEKLFGIVPQEIQLFSGSIIENIALGDPNPDLKHIQKLSDQLGITSFLEQMADGLYTHIGENGVQLSGGQKQRLGIARALYRDPEILLMDEATSSLDPDSEAIILKTVHRLKEKGKTVVIIAHKASTIGVADRVVSISNGKVRSMGMS